MISADIFDESSLSSYCVASEFDVKKLELSAQLELKKLESVEREREREEREREREREIELKKFELQNNLELKVSGPFVETPCIFLCMQNINYAEISA